MEKRIAIGMAGSETKDFRDIALLPNTRVKDVLKQLDLNGYSLANPSGGMFGASDNLYDVVSDGEKIFATKAEVVAGR